MIGRVVHSGMHAQVLNGLVAEVRPEWNATHAELTDWETSSPYCTPEARAKPEPTTKMRRLQIWHPPKFL